LTSGYSRLVRYIRAFSAPGVFTSGKEKPHALEQMNCRMLQLGWSTQNISTCLWTSTRQSEKSDFPIAFPVSPYCSGEYARPSAVSVLIIGKPPCHTAHTILTRVVGLCCAAVGAKKSAGTKNRAQPTLILVPQYVGRW